MNTDNSSINRQIGNYRVISELSSGACGRVYLAQHTLLAQRTVAIKILHATHLTSAEQRENFLQEGQFLEQLKHPYILPILDVGIVEGFPYLVTEYESHGSLRDRIKRLSPDLLPLHESLTILSQIGQALSYAHQQQIIHRDMKPENILFNAKNEALLADFGLATSLSTTSIKHVDSAGTPRYMAPEQFQGDVSKESDQYGLACIAYELVTGRPPFTDKDFYALGYQHLTEVPIPPSQLNPHLPATLDQVILKAMAKRRTDRYHDVSSFISALLQATHAQSHQLISTSMSTLLAPNGKKTLSGSHPDPLHPLVTITPQDTNQRHVITSSHPHLSSVTPTNLGDLRPGQEVMEEGGRHGENDAAFPHTKNWAISHSSSTTPSHAGYRWLLLAIVGLVIGASLLGGILLLAPHSSSITVKKGASLARGTIPSGTAAGSTHPSSTRSPLLSTPTGPTTPQATVHSTAPSSIQPTVPPTPDPPSGSSPTPTTPPPTPTKPPFTPTTPPTSETLTVDFANPSGTQTTNSYSGSITVTVSGAGGVGSKGWSDAFYQYVHFLDGTPINPPQHTSCYVMLINGAQTDGLVSPIPAYNPNHWYQFPMNAPGGTLNFSICDHSYSDNHGSLSVTITQNRNSSA